MRVNFDFHPVSFIGGIGFSAILILIGVLPMVIAPVVESGVLPVYERVQDAQQAVTVMNSVQTAAADLFQWLGGA